MAEWTKNQSDQITSLYGQLKGSHEKNAYQKLFGGTKLPYEEAHSTLLNLLKQQETEQRGGLEAKVKTQQPASVLERIGSLFSRPSVAAGATALLLLYLGLPPTY